MYPQVTQFETPRAAAATGASAPSRARLALGAARAAQEPAPALSVSRSHLGRKSPVRAIRNHLDKEGRCDISCGSRRREMNSVKLVRERVRFCSLLARHHPSGRMRGARNSNSAGPRPSSYLTSPGSSRVILRPASSSGAGPFFDVAGLPRRRLVHDGSEASSLLAPPGIPPARGHAVVLSFPAVAIELDTLLLPGRPGTHNSLTMLRATPHW